MALSPEKLSNMLVTAILKHDAGGIASVVSMGADPNQSDSKGNTPLVIAATDPREHVALNALLSVKADPNVAGKNGVLPLHAALRMRDEKVIAAAVDILVGGGADLNLSEKRPGEFPATPLHVAVASNRSDKIIEKLLRAGADAVRDTDRAMGVLPPLHVLAEQGRYALIEVAAACGADMNKTDREGRTPLMMAARGGAVRTIETLLECGADPTVKDKLSLDALYYLRTSGVDADMRALSKMMSRAAIDYSFRKEIQFLRGEVASIRRALSKQRGEE